MSDATEDQKRRFNKCEKILLTNLLVIQAIFIVVGTVNLTVIAFIPNAGNLTFAVEGCLYLMVFIIAAFVSGLFIRTVNTQRKALWPTVKVELLSIFILISVTYLYKIGNRIYIFYDGQTNTGDRVWFLIFDFTEVMLS